MTNDSTGENQTDKNQETEGQQVKRLREDRNKWQKESKTQQAKKSHWKKKAEALLQDGNPGKKDKKESTESNEPDYAKLAFLNGKKVSHPDDQKLVLDEAERLKLPLTDVLEMQHIKTQLKDTNDQREAKAGMPKGGGKAGGGTGQHDVDFWLDQKNKDGTYKTPEDQELAGKVIDARVKKQTDGGHYDDGPLYTG